MKVKERPIYDISLNMTAEEVIKAVLNNHPKEGWFVYRYKLSWATLGLVFRLSFVALFAWMSWVLLVMADPPEIGFAIPFVVLGIIMLLSSLNQIRTMLYSEKNMIVLTEKKLIKSWRGKLYEYNYSQIKNLLTTRVFGGLDSGLFMPEQYVTFVDDETGKTIELARNRTFGLAANISSSLQSKLNI